MTDRIVELELGQDAPEGWYVVQVVSERLADPLNRSTNSLALSHRRRLFTVLISDQWWRAGPPPAVPTFEHDSPYGPPFKVTCA